MTAFDAVPEKLGVAVSGGSDSMALMHLVAHWAGDNRSRITILTVDHGLRPEAAAEAQYVKSCALTLGFTHKTLLWRGWDGQGNTQNAARMARYDLMHEALGQGGCLLTGHTQDDQAETVLMRMKRGSGVDGLAGMRADRVLPNGLRVLRPMLGMRRHDLRAYLSHLGVSWMDDPSNDNPDYDRVVMRQLIPTLEASGITVEKLTDLTQHMDRAAHVLRKTAEDWFALHGRQSALGLHFQADAFFDLSADTQTRILAAAVMWTTQAPYRPRYQSLRAVIAALSDRHAQTIQGVLIYVNKKEIHILREFARCAPPVINVVQGQVWDDVWEFRGAPPKDDLTLGPLGRAGVAQLDPQARGRLPSRALWPQPALFQRDRLVAAPTIDGNYTEFLLDRRSKFREFLKGH